MVQSYPTRGPLASRFPRFERAPLPKCAERPALAAAPRMRDTGGMEFLLRLAATMAGIWAATRLVPDIRFAEGTSTEQTVLALAVIALVFTVVNSFVKPIVATLALPLYIVTFGLFALVTNAAMFMLTGWLSTKLGFAFQTGGFWSCVAGAIITAIVASVVSGLVGAGKKE